MQKITGIYKITCLSNNKIYIGSANNIYKRWNEHIWELNNQKHDNKHLQDAWNKYGEENFVFEIIEECNKDIKLDREQYYLDLYEPYNRDKGFNIAKNALAPMDGRKHSEETKKHFSETRKGELHPWWGRHHSEETRRKLSEIHKGLQAGENNPFYGKHHTDEAKRKVSEANKGKHRTEEQKQHLSEVFSGSNNPFYGKKHSEDNLKKMSENRKGKCCGEENPNSREVIKLDDNLNYIETYITVTEASIKNNTQRSHIASVCKGKRKHAGGFKWMYKEDYEKYIKDTKSA